MNIRTACVALVTVCFLAALAPSSALAQCDTTAPALTGFSAFVTG